jgi:hypothetical protein
VRRCSVGHAQMAEIGEGVRKDGEVGIGLGIGPVPSMEHTVDLNFREKVFEG